MPPLVILFPQLRGFRFLTFDRLAQCLVIVCERVTQTAPCPLCGVPARRVHSHYQRTVWDVPIQQTSVLLRLHVRKFYCDTANCPRRIFTERLPEVVPPHGRYTCQLHKVLEDIGQEHGGAAGARTLAVFGLVLSSRTILRALHARPLAAVPPPRIIGLDDWAWKKRVRYGAVVVDLERHRPIALLPERSAATVSEWLREHPTITTVARDRSKEFATAITQALPQAQQVADRWHLAHNLTEILDTVVTSHWKALLHALRAPDPLPVMPLVEHHQNGHQAVGAERYQQALTLAQAGVSAVGIAQRLGTSVRTINRWLHRQHGPYEALRKPCVRPQTWATAYLRERWEAGEHNGTVLWEELRARGYHGSLRSVYRRLATWRRHHIATYPKRSLPARSPWEDITPRQVVGWSIARPETLTSSDQQRLAALCDADPVLQQACHVLQGWLAMIRQHTAAPLDDWLTQVRASGIAQFSAFARSVERDKASIIAGLTLSYSTGPVEGHIHKLKLIKCQAYGRASLAYLQRRFLSA